MNPPTTHPTTPPQDRAATTTQRTDAWSPQEEAVARELARVYATGWKHRSATFGEPEGMSAADWANANWEMFTQEAEALVAKLDLSATAARLAEVEGERDKAVRTLEAYRVRARKLYTPEVAATKIPEVEEQMRNVDKRLEIAIGVLKFYGFELVDKIAEGVKMLTTDDGKCAFVRVLEDGQYAAAKKACEQYREEFAKSDAITLRAQNADLTARLATAEGELMAVQTRSINHAIAWTDANDQLTALRTAAEYAHDVFKAHNDCKPHSTGMEKAVAGLSAALAPSPQRTDSHRATHEDITGLPPSK